MSSSEHSQGDPSPASDKNAEPSPSGALNAQADESTSGVYPDFQSDPEFEARHLQAPERNWEPSGIAMDCMDQLAARSPIVAVCSRFMPEHLGDRLLNSRLQPPKKVWHLSPTGICANGDIAPLLAHLREGHGEGAVYRLALSSSLSRSGPPALLRSLLDDSVFASLATALKACSAMLLLAITHAEEFPFQHVQPERKELIKAACDAESGWIYEASWQREMPRSWLLSPAASAANDEPYRLIDGAENRLTSAGERLSREHRFYNLMETFSHEWVWRAGGGVSADELVRRFDEALRLAETDGFDASVRTWIDEVAIVLAKPPQEAKLEKLMLTLAACTALDWQYSAFRQFGALALFGQKIPEDVTVDSEEVRNGDRRVSRLRRVIRQAPADEAWNAHFDHLARALGLSFRTTGSKRLVQFKDPFCRPALRDLLFTNFPSLVTDLVDQLLQLDALFHVDIELRECAIEFLSQLDVFDPGFTTRLVRQALLAAERLIDDGPRPDSPLGRVAHAVFKQDREHALCVAELFDAVARTSQSASIETRMRALLLENRLWERGRTNLDALLLRTEVLLTLPGLDGMEQLRGYIDDADEEVFQPLLHAMLRWPRFGGEKSALLSRLAPWLQLDDDARGEWQRSRLLSQSVWVAAVASDLRSTDLRYREKWNTRSMGYQVLNTAGRLRECLPGLVRVRWREAHIGGMDVRSLRNAMARLLLVAPESHAAAPLIERHETVLVEAGDAILFQPWNEANAPIPEDKNGTNEPRDAAHVLFLKLAYEAYQQSSGDPKGFVREMTRLMQVNQEYDHLIQPFLQQAATSYDELAWPLGLMPGIVLAHWCFAQTGIDADAERLDTETGAANRDAVRLLLDTLWDSLKDQPLACKPAVISTHWAQIIRLLGSLCEAVHSLSDDVMEASHRRVVVEMLKTKQHKLDLLRKGLERRMQATYKEPA